MKTAKYLFLNFIFIILVQNEKIRILNTMARASNLCEIKQCELRSIIFCNHCDKNVCRHHLNEHSDAMLKDISGTVADEVNRYKKYLMQFDLNELKRQPLEILDEWRQECYIAIDDIYELKRKEIEELAQQVGFQKKKDELMTDLDKIRDEINKLFKSQDTTYEQAQTVKQQLDDFKIELKKIRDLIKVAAKKIRIDGSDFVNVRTTKSSNSTIFVNGFLLNKEQELKLNDFYGDKTQRWQLVYSATRDGFGAEDFHRCCDNRGPTITVIKSKDNCLFGGYTKISWSTSGSWKTDSTGFLFTLTNPQQTPAAKFIIKNGAYGVLHRADRGPCFGGGNGSDIYIYSNSNVNKQSVCKFSQKQNDTKNNEDQLLTGSQQFIVEDIEVYILMTSKYNMIPLILIVLLNLLYLYRSLDISYFDTAR